MYPSIGIAILEILIVKHLVNASAELVVRGELLVSVYASLSTRVLSDLLHQLAFLLKISSKTDLSMSSARFLRPYSVLVAVKMSQRETRPITFLCATTSIPLLGSEVNRRMRRLQGPMSRWQGEICPW
jgi:hypothetical protein